MQIDDFRFSKLHALLDYDVKTIIGLNEIRCNGCGLNDPSTLNGEKQRVS